MLGTVHVGNKLLLNLNPNINKALKKSPIIAFECKMNRIYSSKIYRILLKRESDPIKREEIKYSLDEQALYKRGGFSNAYGLEACIFRKIQSLKEGNAKEFVGLEPIEEHAAAVFVKNEPLPVKESDKRIQLNRFRLIYRQYLEGTNFFCEEKEVIKRNKNMVEKAESLLSHDRKVFIAVGASHISGENGMQKIFESKGYFLKNCDLLRYSIVEADGSQLK